MGFRPDVLDGKSAFESGQRGERASLTLGDLLAKIRTGISGTVRIAFVSIQWARVK
jgi:hypothetical protein